MVTPVNSVDDCARLLKHASAMIRLILKLESRQTARKPVPTQTPDVSEVTVEQKPLRTRGVKSVKAAVIDALRNNGPLDAAGVYHAVQNDPDVRSSSDLRKACRAVLSICSRSGLFARSKDLVYTLVLQPRTVETRLLSEVKQALAANGPLHFTDLMKLVKPMVRRSQPKAALTDALAHLSEVGEVKRATDERYRLAVK